MKAIVKRIDGVRLEERPIPTAAINDVIIRVMIAGLCRTDMYIAQMPLGIPDGIVLGHEFSGIVESVGNNVRNVEIGDHVGVMPVFNNSDGKIISLGKDRDGAFAEYVAVPAPHVFPIPKNMSFEKGAYLEPAAASLAVTQIPLNKDSKGLIYGENRIAELTRRILLIHGFTSIDICAHETGKSLHDNGYDFVVETIMTDDALGRIIDITKPSGTIVLKSRPFESAMLPTAKIVQKELRLVGVHYGDFKESIRLLASDTLKVDDLFGQTFAFEDAVRILSGQKKISEDKKIFFRP